MNVATASAVHRGLRSAQVETAACYCRAEAGLTVVGAKKFVSGTRACTQSEIKPSTYSSSRNRGKGERKKLPPDLIPGLPNDLAVACLLRVPRFYHRNLRLVCRKWYHLLTSNYFFSRRIQLGMAEEWVYVIKRDRDGRVSWHAFDPKCQTWHPLPPVPIDFSDALGFGCAVLSGYLLFLFGGKVPTKGSSMRKVVYYSPRTNKWHHAPDMLRRRHFFSSCVMNNCLYVAGGECEGNQRTLRLAEMFDPSKNKWSFISDMSTSMAPFISVVYDGRWYIKGLGPHRQVVSAVYAPSTNSWSPTYDGMVAGWRNLSALLNGKLYALDCQDGCKLRVYNPVSDSWVKSVDSKAHLGTSQAVEAAALLPLLGKLCIVRNNSSIALVDVENPTDPENQREMWETITAKGQSKSVVSSLWSNISGRNKHKFHIVHCQVLQA